MKMTSSYDILHALLESSNSGKDVSRYADKRFMERIFEIQVEQRSFIYSVSALDLSFRPVASTEPVDTQTPSPISDIPLFKSLRHDEIRFSDIIETGEFGARARCLVATCAIYNTKGEHIGYLIQEITLELFENLRLSSSLITDGSIYITDGVGRLITAETRGEKQNDYKLDKHERGNFAEAWAGRDLSGPTGVITYDIDGVTFMSCYGGLQYADWTILSSVCLDNILQTRKSYMHVILAVILVTLVLMVAVEKVMTRVLTAPIEQMMRTLTNARSHRDFSVRIAQIPKNELGVIATEVNSLLTDIETIIRRQKERMRDLKERAARDPLTGLLNKSAIEDVLSLKLDSARVNKGQFACVLVDIDDFKAYNTRYGHAGGDEVIRFVASQMSEISHDTAGRIGGAEFLMCLDCSAGLQDAIDCVERFMHRLKEGVCLEEGQTPVPVSCSNGIALPRDLSGPTGASIIQAADSAMYEVKNTAKNGYRIAT